jgi:alpha-1,2-mannosyltransferase
MATMSMPSGPAAWRWRLGGWAALALSAAFVMHAYLVDFPGELWQLDLEVYRDGGVSLLTGRPLYEWLTGAPQFLPFTYPPFSAVMMVPLALVPFSVAGWLWSMMQVWLVWLATGLAFRPFLDRFAHRAPLVQGLVAAGLLLLRPVTDGIRFGQVNAVVVTLCLADAVRRHGQWAPSGTLTGLAAAVKLTPATFWLHYAAARRWRTLATSMGAAAVATLVAAAISPSASLAYWTDAVLDPTRLGPNDGVSNQSMRGVLMRVGPRDPRLQTLVWVLLVVAVLGLGLRVSVRLDRLGEPVAVVAAVAMVAVLVSPVSWVHHWHWGIAVIAALLGDGRRRRSQVAATVATAALYFDLPWWGGSWPGHGPVVSALGLVVQQSYTIFAVVALWRLWRLADASVPQGTAPTGKGPARTGARERGPFAPLPPLADVPEKDDHPAKGIVP